MSIWRNPKLSLFIFLFPVLGLCGYNGSIALEMCYMSDIAYATSEQIDSWTCSNCSMYKIQHQNSFNYKEIQAFAGYLPNLKAIVLSFRGTDDISNWITDFKGIKVPLTTYAGCSNCKVHDGFDKSYNGIRPHVLSALQNLQNIYKGASVYVTGHSLGGALAILAALDLDQIGLNIAGVYTYGQPRVGNENFASFYETNIP